MGILTSKVLSVIWTDFYILLWFNYKIISMEAYFCFLGKDQYFPSNFLFVIYLYFWV